MKMLKNGHDYLRCLRSAEGEALSKDFIALYGSTWSTSGQVAPLTCFQTPTSWIEALGRIT